MEKVVRERRNQRVGEMQVKLVWKKIKTPKKKNHLNGPRVME